MSINISKAIDNDVKNIAKIYHQTGLIHHQHMKDEFIEPKIEDAEKFLSEIINKETSVLFKAVIDGKIVGYLDLYINQYPSQFFYESKRGFIGSVGVDESVRGKGVGTQLMKHAENYLKEQGIKIFETDVYVFNTKAEKLYNEFGFEDIKHYKRKHI